MGVNKGGNLSEESSFIFTGRRRERFERKLDVPLLCLEWIVSLLIADECLFVNKWVRFPCFLTSFFYLLVLISAVSVFSPGKGLDERLLSCTGAAHTSSTFSFPCHRDQVGHTWTKGKRTIFCHDNLIGEHLSLNRYAN